MNHTYPHQHRKKIDIGSEKKGLCDVGAVQQRNNSLVEFSQVLVTWTSAHETSTQSTDADERQYQESLDFVGNPLAVKCCCLKSLQFSPLLFVQWKATQCKQTPCPTSSQKHNSKLKGDVKRHGNGSDSKTHPCKYLQIYWPQIHCEWLSSCRNFHQQPWTYQVWWRGEGLLIAFRQKNTENKMVLSQYESWNKKSETFDATMRCVCKVVASAYFGVAPCLTMLLYKDQVTLDPARDSSLYQR